MESIFASIQVVVSFCFFISIGVLHYAVKYSNAKKSEEIQLLKAQKDKELQSVTNAFVYVIKELHGNRGVVVEGDNHGEINNT